MQASVHVFRLKKKQFYKSSSFLFKGGKRERSFKLNSKDESLIQNKFFERTFDKSRLKKFVRWFIHKWGLKRTIFLLDTLKFLGFKYARFSGISLNLEDLYVPSNKNKLVKINQFQLLEQEFKVFLKNSEQNAYSIKFIATWTSMNEILRDSFLQYFKNRIYPPSNIQSNFQLSSHYEPDFNTKHLKIPKSGSDSLYIMAFSGARGNMSQVSQLTLMRGLMSDPLGKLVEFPIISNFKEGLNLTEYLISCYGARKGIIDTGLRTATAGDFTRRLVDVAHSVIIQRFDCGTQNGIYLNDLMLSKNKKNIFPLKQRLIGRIIANHSRIPKIYRNKEISLDFFSIPLYQFRNFSKTNFEHILENFEFLGLSDRIASNSFLHLLKLQATLKNENEIACNSIIQKKKSVFQNASTVTNEVESWTEKVISEEIIVRSPLTCEASPTPYLCRKCYGWNAIGRLIDVGEAVGILAAQSLGEPGTQLTLRTFHTGGIYSEQMGDFKLIAPFDGNVRVVRVYLQTDSFISAASFQSSSKILSQESLKKSKDFLFGLKESIIVNELIPSGTGIFIAS
nr:RNA polymerase beta'' subunit [Trentepohlia sp. YN1317]